MSDPFDFFGDMSADVPSIPDFSGDQVMEAPQTLDVLPDGRDVIVIGDVTGAAEYNHHQGDNPYGISGDCGVVSCENVLDQFGVHLTETDLIQYAGSCGLCDLTSDKGSEQGGTTPENQAAILTSYGVPAHVEYQSVDALAQSIEDGHGVVAELNAGVIWNDPNSYDDGSPNHAVNVSGVARDPVTGEIDGFYINDSGSGASGQFVSLETFEAAWSPLGEGAVVVTDNVRTFDA